MIYTFNAYGHLNIQGTHKTTLEFTKDSEVSLNGDCIVGVKADFDLNRIRDFIEKSKNNKVTIILRNNNIQEKIAAELNPNFNSSKEFVIRKTDFVSERTFAIKANQAAFDLNRDLINYLQDKKNKIIVIIQNNG